jgi:hypothetical protein
VYSLKIAAGYALNIEPTGNSNTRRAGHGKIGVQGFAAQRAASTTPADSESGDAESIGTAGHAQVRAALIFALSSPTAAFDAPTLLARVDGVIETQETP